MKLKYNTQTGEVLCMGEMPDLQAGNNESVVDVAFAIPSEPLNYFTFNGTALVRKDQGVIDAMNVYANFNPELAIAREAQVFDVSALARLMPVSYTINELIRFKNFWGGVINGSPYAGLKQIGQGLVVAGTITQDDYDKLNGILQEQGIDLDA